MKTYDALPQPLLADWTKTTETHPPGQAVPFHYHDMPEWLQVTNGEITFFTLSGEPHPVRPGTVLNVPRGEVHRADIGPAGVQYDMYLPVSHRTGFSNFLSNAEIALLQANLEFPLHEENADGSAPAFFDGWLSDSLVFYRADGTIADKRTYLASFTPEGRASSGTVAVLNRTAMTLLLSTVVITRAAGAAPAAFTNIRVFLEEAAGWKCRIWINSPSVSER